MPSPLNHNTESEAPRDTEAGARAKRPVSAGRIGGLIFVNVVATLLLLLVLEGITSVYYSFQEAFAEKPLAERLYTEYDPDLGWINLPNIDLPNMYGPGKYLATNAQRFRSNSNFTQSVPAGKTRIICSGDSFTFGYGVDNDHTWPQSLVTRAPNIETINMAQGGYGADQAYLWYKRDAAKFDYDIQILAVISPDIYRMQSASFEGYGKPILELKDNHLVTANVPVPRSIEVRSPKLVRVENALSNLSLTRALRNTFKFNFGAAVGQTQWQRNEETKKILPLMLDDLVATNRARNSVFALAYLPVKREFADDPSLTWHNFLADYAVAHNILFLDLAEDFHRLPRQEFDQMFLTAGAVNFPGAAGHYTEAGNAFVAQNIYRRLLANPETAARLHAQPTTADAPAGNTSR